jgi:tartrate dehydratase alpha subunit/fumarate hydratase class I-like protein
MYINGMTNTNDVINMIKDTIDDGNLDSAKDYLEQLKEKLVKDETERAKTTLNIVKQAVNYEEEAQEAIDLKRCFPERDWGL